MTNNRSAEIKDYICQTFANEDEALSAAKEHALKEELPPIAIPENVGKLIYLLAKIQKPKRILEVGTLGGYSTLWLAKGAPDAEIITLEYNPKHAAVARENFQRAGQGKIKVIEGDALKTLQNFIKNGETPFDLIFLDADKEDYPAYLPFLLALSGPNTLLLTDNLIPKVSPINKPLEDDLTAVKIYQYNEMLASHQQIDTILATTIVGESGRIDALGISLIESNDN